jgi:hypothetical protein
VPGAPFALKKARDVAESPAHLRAKISNMHRIAVFVDGGGSILMPRENELGLAYAYASLSTPWLVMARF